MKILFVYFNLNSPISYSCGVAYLSAILKKERYKVDILHLNDLWLDTSPIEAVMNQVRAGDYNVVCCSAISSQQKYLLDVLRNLQELGPHRPWIIVGGLLATFDPESVKGLADFIVRGEAEESLPGILDAIQNNDFSGQVISQGFIDLNDLPPMDMEAFDYDKIIRYKNGWLEMMIGRGCPFSCSYCFNEEIKNLYGSEGYIRFKPIDLVIEELSQLKNQCLGLRVINFVDDNFTYDLSYLGNLMEQYSREIALPYLCASRSEFLGDEAIEILKDSGCKMVRMGLESGSEDLKRKVLNRHDSNEHIIYTARKLQEAGIEVGLFNIIGIPGETGKDIEHTLRLNAAIKPATSKRSILLPFKGTDVYRQWEKQIDKQALFNQTQYNNCKSVFMFDQGWHDMIEYYRINWAVELSKASGVKYDFLWDWSVAVREDYGGIV